MHPHLTIHMRDIFISIADEGRYFGVILDSKITLLRRILNLQKKARGY